MWMAGVFNHRGGIAPRVDRVRGRYRLRRRQRGLPRQQGLRDHSDAARAAGQRHRLGYRRVRQRRQTAPTRPVWKTVFLAVLALMFSYAVLEAISTGITASRWHAVSMREAPIGYFFFLGLYVFGAFMSLKSLLLNPSEGAPAKAGLAPSFS